LVAPSGPMMTYADLPAWWIVDSMAWDIRSMVLLQVLDGIRNRKNLSLRARWQH